jgi:2,4-dienoyl-CoA reductase-like NADH-dependent reductase (Old Yellow Enzyme family)/thioredoxin reductase
MAELNRLFTPVKIGNIDIKNRLMFLPTNTFYGGGMHINDRLKSFYLARAKGGVGLLDTGEIAPFEWPEGRITCLHEDSLIPEHRELVNVIHSYGSKILAQIGWEHKWRKGKNSPCEVVTPSGVVISGREPVVRALNLDEIHQMVEEFSEAVRRARSADYDGVEIHAGNGLLISQFLSPYTNQRTDEYGGTEANRLRFLLDLIAASKRKAGEDFLLTCKVCGDDFMPGGNTLEDMKRIIPIIADAGIKCFNIAAGWHETRKIVSTTEVPQAGFVYLAENIKQVTNVPVVTGYRITEPFAADKILSEGKADIIGMCRALLADPELPNKAKEGRFDETRPCIGCCQCLDDTFQEIDIRCSVNPWLGHESEYVIKKTTKPKRVFVVGGGPAGMEAASIAAMRGNRVTLFEKEDRLGGQLLPAAVAPYKGECNKLTYYLVNELKKNDVEVKLGNEVTVNTIEEGKPDVVVVASGAVPSIPDITGVSGSNVVTAVEVLNGVKETGKEVVVVGGGLIGCETAEYLANKGKKVTITTRQRNIGTDIGPSNRFGVRERIKKAGVRIVPQAVTQEITANGTRVSLQEGETIIEADTVVLAGGMKPADELAAELENKGIKFRKIGDCVEARRIREAIDEGLHVGCEI